VFVGFEMFVSNDIFFILFFLYNRFIDESKKFKNLKSKKVVDSEWCVVFSAVSSPKRSVELK